MRKSLISAAVISTLHFASASTIALAQVAAPVPVPQQQVAPTREEIERTIGAVAGGYLAAHFAQKLPQSWVKSFVIAVGTAMTVYFFWRAYQ